ncbi:hypothetical protein STVA_17690 [Allostella vacuolata]|nr:hypothetical protein STVA_17690 [Stella vacuolata]
MIRGASRWVRQGTAAGVALLLAGCAVDGAFPILPGSNLDQVWNTTRIYHPQRSGPPANPHTLGDLQLPVDGSRTWPAVIFLHGCTGFSGAKSQAQYPPALARAGFAVFVPDSFARGPARQPVCGNVRSDTIALRHAEVESTLAHIRRLPWVDQKNLFLAGHSEGGIATAMYDGGEVFRAYFIAGWSCSSTNPDFARIHAPRARPVLAIIGANDSLQVGTAREGHHCGMRMSGRSDSRSIVLPGIGHEATDHYSTLPTLIEFFSKHRQ